MNVLLSGVTGSVAYELSTPESDVDRLGIFAYPTERLLGLGMPEMSVVKTHPDITMHEAGKFVSLALKCNPTITELLWLPDELYETKTLHGEELISIRSSLLSREYVRNAYLGYATQQFVRLRNRADGSFSADTRKRTAKHARHLARLLDQGFMLWAFGTLSVQVSDPGLIRDFGEKVAAGDTQLAEQALARREADFDVTPSALPECPDRDAAEDWLLRVRRQFYDAR